MDDEEIMQKCAKRLKECRIENNYTLDALAQKLGIVKTTILRWENGSVYKIRSHTIKYLADLYKVNPVWLLGYDSPKYVKRDNTTKMLDVSDLSDEDYDFIVKQIEYMRWKNQKR